MITYHVQVAMTDMRQVEITSNDGLEFPAIKKLACEKARSEHGEYDLVEVEDYEVALV